MCRLVRINSTASKQVHPCPDQRTGGCTLVSHQTMLSMGSWVVCCICTHTKSRSHHSHISIMWHVARWCLCSAVEWTNIRSLTDLLFSFSRFISVTKSVVACVSRVVLYTVRKFRFWSDVVVEVLFARKAGCFLGSKVGAQGSRRLDWEVDFVRISTKPWVLSVFVRPIHLKLDPYFVSRKCISFSVEHTDQMMCSVTGILNVFKVKFC